jgi:hypothetical protein
VKSGAACPDALILDSTVYEWRARDELAVASHFLGDRAESARLWRELVADRRLPAGEREQRNVAVAETNRSRTRDLLITNRFCAKVHNVAQHAAIGFI